MREVIDPTGDKQKSKRSYTPRAKKLVLTEPLLRQLMAFAQIQCTQKEASKVLGVSHRLLVQFLADHPEAREAWDRGRSLGHVSLRRLLWRQAQHNSAQARFLGKHWLGMDVKTRQAITDTTPSVLSDDENVARIHELIAEARRRSNRIIDPKLPDSAASAPRPRELPGDLSATIEDFDELLGHEPGQGLGLELVDDLLGLELVDDILSLEIADDLLLNAPDLWKP